MALAVKILSDEVNAKWERQHHKDGALSGRQDRSVHELRPSRAGAGPVPLDEGRLRIGLNLAAAYAPEPPLRSEDTTREPVPIASDGERPLPDAQGPSPCAPKSNRNALKHGRYTAKALDNRRRIAALLRVMRELAKEV